MFPLNVIAGATGSVLTMVAGTTSGGDFGYSSPAILDTGSLNPDQVRTNTVVHQVTGNISDILDIRFEGTGVPNTDATFRQVVFTEIPDAGFGRQVYLRSDATYGDFGGNTRWQWFGGIEKFVSGNTYQCVYS